MKKIKKATVVLGGTLGGIVGGTLSFTGKLAKVQFLDSLGESILDSALYSGEIAGELVSGVSDIAIGKIKKDKERIAYGKKDLKSGTGKIAQNYISNFKLIGGSGIEIAAGVLARDKVRVIKGGKRIIKIIAVGAMTVGAIKLEDSHELKEKSDLQSVKETRKAETEKRLKRKYKIKKKYRLRKKEHS